MLDFGCGLGQTSELLQQLRPDLRLTLGDPYRSCLDIADRHVRAETVVLPEDVVDLDDLAGSFDGLIASHVIEHALDPVGMSRALMTVLRPGGTAVLAVPNPARPKVLWYGIRRHRYANRGHVVAWDAAHWRVFLEYVLDLEVVDYLADEVQIFPPQLANRSLVVRRIERALARPLPWWSFSNIAVVRSSGPAATGCSEHT